MKRLIKKAYDLAEEQEKFIQECEESGKFDDKQMNEIIWGFEHGLTMEQVKLYADPKFDWKQMEEIGKGFENGLTIEQTKFYADPKFKWNQMYPIRKDFENGLTIEEIKSKYKLASRKNKLNRIANNNIPNIFEFGLTKKQVLDDFADNVVDFYTIEEIKEFFEEYPTIKDQINLINDTITVCVNESYFDLWDKYYNCNPKLINEYCEKYNVDIKEIIKQILNNISIDEFLDVAVKARIDFYNRNFEKYMK